MPTDRGRRAHDRGRGARAAAAPEGVRLFFASFPDPTGRAAVQMAAGRIGDPAWQRVDAPRLHLTVHFIGRRGDVPAALLDRALRAGDALDLAGFDTVLDRRTVFAAGPARVAHVLLAGAGASALRALHDRLADAVPAHRDARPFVPHLTVAYATGPSSTVAEPIDPIALRIGHVALVRSDDGAADYRILARWPLRR